MKKAVGREEVDTEVFRCYCMQRLEQGSSDLEVVETAKELHLDSAKSGNELWPIRACGDVLAKGCDGTFKSLRAHNLTAFFCERASRQALEQVRRDFAKETA